jgi:phage terminase Nu1 subunit (DNA packaging protein)
MGYLSRSALARESHRTLHEIDKLLTLGLPHQVIGSGRGSEVRVDRSEALTWLVGLALSTASTESDDDAPEVVKQRARLFRLQADSQAMKNDVARGQLLPASEVVLGW